MKAENIHRAVKMGLATGKHNLSTGCTISNNINYRHDS